MLRLTIAAALLAGAVPAAAEDWWHVATEGDAPTRRVGMFDVASVDRTDPGIPSLDLALWSETPDEFGYAIIVTKVAIDCDAATFTIVWLDLRNSEGESIGSESTEGRPFAAIEEGSYFDMMHAAVCAGQMDWPNAYRFGEGRTLGQLSSRVFGD